MLTGCTVLRLVKKGHLCQISAIWFCRYVCVCTTWLYSASEFAKNVYEIGKMYKIPGYRYFEMLLFIVCHGPAHTHTLIDIMLSDKIQRFIKMVLSLKWWLGSGQYKINKKGRQTEISFVRLLLLNSIHFFPHYYPYLQTWKCTGEFINTFLYNSDYFHREKKSPVQWQTLFPLYILLLLLKMCLFLSITYVATYKSFYYHSIFYFWFQAVIKEKTQYDTWNIKSCFFSIPVPSRWKHMQTCSYNPYIF